MQQASRAFWPVWVARLQNWKLDGFVAWLLEAGAPLTLLSAQVIYFANPFFTGKHAQMVAEMLEEDGETRAFIDFLRQQETSG
jgi:hypothetical protein